MIRCICAGDGNFISRDYTYGAEIIAGMGDGVDANREPDEYGAFMDVFHNSGVFALCLAR